MENFVSMKSLSKSELLHLIKRSDEVANGTSQQQNQTKPLFVANLFFEPSTRTKMSFEVAEKNLGMHVLDFHAETSSTLKGESVYDTAKTFESIGADALVIRHPEKGQVSHIAESINIPVINAGDGAGEHPTQSLLDLYTMYQEFGSFNDLDVLIVGDIAHSRVAKSNAYALQTLGANVYLSSKADWQDETLDFPYIDLDEGIKQCDVAMFLRIQLERHEKKESIESTDYLKRYGLTVERERKMRKHAIIMHPAPVNRDVEIASELVECKRSRIFKQMENGVYTRMAVLEACLKKEEPSYGTHYHTVFTPARASIS
ncbi:aspartate carbamoyltransferase [Pelagirhabdus alkalitolerans]|uniref:Aspartate carbamoyltransferase n=2 Tax=Pelagirhabdus alkalitolerans TaxID=1612202 RepID=A0A1G6H0L5_9BACI|nr:aspartate carbamoyltransferase [Pelagirhabdus alkalitolerans]